jgi:hypothetical protein
MNEICSFHGGLSSRGGYLSRTSIGGAEFSALRLAVATEARLPVSYTSSSLAANAS